MGFLDKYRRQPKPVEVLQDKVEREDKEHWKRERKRVNTEKMRRLAGGAISSLYNSFGNMKDAMSDTEGKGKPPISQMHISRSMAFNIDTEKLKSPGMPKGGLDFTSIGMPRSNKRKKRRY